MAQDRPQGAVLWLALAVGASYAAALGNGFVLDDYGLILHNTFVRDFDWAAILTRDYWAGFDGRKRIVVSVEAWDP